MYKYVFVGLTFLCLPAIGFTQAATASTPVPAGVTGTELAKRGWTPFRPPTHFPPEEGKAALENDPAYPKYLVIYDAIQVNFGSQQALATIATQIAQLQKDYPKSPYPLFALAESKYAAGPMNRNDTEIYAILDRTYDLGGWALPDRYILDAKMAADRGYVFALGPAQRAVHFAPKKPEAQFALGRAQQINKHYAEAEEAYRAFISLEDNPKRKANGYSWLAEMLSHKTLTFAERAKFRDKAKDAWRQAADLDPNYRHLMEYGDFLLTSLGDATTATAVFDKLQAQYQEDGSVRFRMGLIDYLKWAKSGSGVNAGTLKAVESRTGMPSDYVFALSAAYDGLATVTQTMLHAKLVKNINAVCDDSPFDLPEQATALDMAAFSDNLALVKELVEHGASVNSPTSDRTTPLIYAIDAADADLTAYLLKKGARVNVANERGTNPMILALEPSPNSRQLVGLLLKYHADPMALNAYGIPAPFDAVQAGNVEALDVLLTEGKVDMKIRHDDRTLLAHGSHNPAMLRYLLSKGADPWAEEEGTDLLVLIHNVYIADNDTEGKAKNAECIAIVEEARRNRPHP